MMWIPILGLVAIAMIVVEAAHGSACEQCFKPFAVFSIHGRLRIRLRVCWRCRQVHHRRRRNYAR